MTFRNNNNQLSYFLRTQSSIVNGEQIIPNNTFRITSQKANINSMSKTKNKSTRYSSCSIKKKPKNMKAVINDNEFLYRGIDLNKVSGYSHSLNNIRIYRNESKNNNNKNIKKLEKGKSLINDKDYYHKCYLNNFGINSNDNLNNNNEGFINNNEKPYYNKYNNYYMNINKDNKLNNKKALKEEYFERRQIGNNNYFEQQYQNSLPSNIPETEILNNPGESMTITGIDNFTNRKNNYVIQSNNEKYESKSNEKLNDMFFKINQLKNEIIKPEKNNIKNNTCYNYKKNKNSLKYYYDGNNNMGNYMKNVLNKENNKENNSMAINKKRDNYINNNSYIKCQINDDDIDNDNYLNNSKNENINSNNITTRKDYQFNKTSTLFNTYKNNYSSLIKNINNNEIIKRNKEPPYSMTKSFFDFDSSNYFYKTQKRSNKNIYMTTFNYNNNNKRYENKEAHKFFGIQMDGNKLEKLLKIIPRHMNENKFQSYQSYINSLQKQKRKNEKMNNNNNYIDILSLNKAKSFNEDFNEIMPPNILNY